MKENSRWTKISSVNGEEEYSGLVLPDPTLTIYQGPPGVEPPHSERENFVMLSRFENSEGIPLAQTVLSNLETNSQEADAYFEQVNAALQTRRREFYYDPSGSSPRQASK